MNNDQKNEIISQEEIKRRKSANIINFPEIKNFSKNLNNSPPSSSQFARSPPLKFKSDQRSLGG